MLGPGSTNRMRNATSLLEMCSLGDVKLHSVGAAFADEAERSRIHTFVKLNRLHAKGMRLGEVTPYGMLAAQLRWCESEDATVAHEYSTALNFVARLADVDFGHLEHSVQMHHEARVALIASRAISSFLTPFFRWPQAELKSLGPLVPAEGQLRVLAVLRASDPAVMELPHALLTQRSAAAAAVKHALGNRDFQARARCTRLARAPT